MIKNKYSYATHIKQLLENLEMELEKITKDSCNEIKNYKNTIIFGASETGIKLSSFLKDNNYEVKYFLDNNIKIHNTIKNGILVSSISEVPDSDKSIPVIVATTSFLARDKITEQLRLNGFTNIISDYLSVYNVFSENQHPALIVQSNLDKVISVMDLLVDERSKEVYANILIARITKDLSFVNYAYNPKYPQYFDRELLDFSHEEVFVDGGAFDGETSKFFINHVVSEKYKKVILFEPDKTNYAVTKNNISGLKNVECINKGLSDEFAQLRFIRNENQPEGAHISNEGTELIIVDSLDRTIKEATFIKLDVEGAELKALSGAVNIITSCKPKLAVCIYHLLEHFWEVPLYIKALNPDYKLYIRHYNEYKENQPAEYSLFETVCYAVS